jgi:HlyD family type I secretion membrane fusion protein
MIPTLIEVLIVSIFLWLIYSKVDVVAPSQGKTIPNSRMNLIQPKDISIIDKVYVKNGQSVKKGDILVKFMNNIETFENTTMKTKHENLLGTYLALKSFIKYIKTEKKYRIRKDGKLPNKVVDRENIKLWMDMESYKSEKESLMIKIKKIEHEKKMITTEISKKEKLLPYTAFKIEQFKPLVERGLESEIMLKDLEYEFIEQEEDIKIRQAEAEKLEAELDVSKKELEQFKNKSLKESAQLLTDTSNELSTLRPEVQKSNYVLELKSIKASVDGIIYNLKNHAHGKVVQSGEIIMELIPDGSPLEVEAKVLNRDIGFIYLGQKVKVKLDSFKFTKYGYIEGVIINIEKASILDENLGEIYPVIIQLSEDKIKVDDKFVQLIPGMTCTTDIMIGKRRLIEYIISPMIRYKDEALREK